MRGGSAPARFAGGGVSCCFDGGGGQGGLRPRHPCIKPPAALTELAKHAPVGGLTRRHRLDLPIRHSTGACLRHRQFAAKPTETLSYEQCRQPRRGGDRGRWNYPSHATAAFEMVLSPGAGRVGAAGGSAPGTPALNRLRHLQTLPNRYPAQRKACGSTQNRKNRLSMSSAGSQGEGGPGERNFGV